MLSQIVASFHNNPHFHKPPQKSHIAHDTECSGVCNLTPTKLIFTCRLKSLLLNLQTGSIVPLPQK